MDLDLQGFPLWETSWIQIRIQEENKTEIKPIPEVKTAREEQNISKNIFNTVFILYSDLPFEIFIDFII